MATATARTAPSRRSGNKPATQAKSQNTRGSRKSTAPASSKVRGKASVTAISQVKPAPKGMTEADPIDAKFRSQAEALDLKITKTVQTIGRDMIALGEMFDTMQTKGYHRALGFVQFTDYVASRFPETSKSQVFQAMRVVRELTSGDAPLVSKEDIRDMTRDNAETLVQLKKEGVPITQALIESAKSLPARRFQAEVAFPAAPRLKARADANAGRTAKPLQAQGQGSYDSGTAAGQNTQPAQVGVSEGSTSESTVAGSTNQVIIMRKVWDLQGDTVAELKRCEEIAKYVTRDEDKSLPWADQFFQSLCAEYRATHEAFYETWLQQQEAAGENAENMTKEQIALSGEDLEEEILVNDSRTVEYDSQANAEELTNA